MTTTKILRYAFSWHSSILPPSSSKAVHWNFDPFQLPVYCFLSLYHYYAYSHTRPKSWKLRIFAILNTQSHRLISVTSISVSGKFHRYANPWAEPLNLHSNKFLVKQQGKPLNVLSLFHVFGKCLVDLPRKIVYRETSVVCKRKSLFVQQGFPRPTTTCTWTCPINRDFIGHSPRYTL